MMAFFSVLFWVVVGGSASVGAAVGFAACALLTAGYGADLRARIVELEMERMRFRCPPSMRPDADPDYLKRMLSKACKKKDGSWA